MEPFHFQEVVPDVFRLNEVSLWYEVLSDPQACCLKWAAEADYIMPVLTPMFPSFKSQCTRLHECTY